MFSTYTRTSGLISSISIPQDWCTLHSQVWNELFEVWTMPICNLALYLDVILHKDYPKTSKRGLLFASLVLNKVYKVVCQHLAACLKLIFFRARENVRSRGRGLYEHRTVLLVRFASYICGVRETWKHGSILIHPWKRSSPTLQTPPMHSDEWNHHNSSSISVRDLPLRRKKQKKRWRRRARL